MTRYRWNVTCWRCGRAYLDTRRRVGRCLLCGSQAVITTRIEDACEERERVDPRAGRCEAIGCARQSLHAAAVEYAVTLLVMHGARCGDIVIPPATRWR